MKTVIAMAREVGALAQQSKNCDVEYVMSGQSLERFATLVAAAERAECKKVCAQVSKDFGDVAEGPFATDFGKHTHMSMAAGAKNCAAAIQARGETK